MKWQPGSHDIFACSDYQGAVSLWDVRSPGMPLGSATDAHGGKALCVDWIHTSSLDSNNLNDSAPPSVVSGGSDCMLSVRALSSIQ